jgi:L-ascorbate metabolism protein UlaG (beta-lactamase superfamily)
MAEFRWFGHNCFRIKAKEATLLTDPVGAPTGFSMGKQTADIVTISHPHKGHSNLDAVKPPYKIIDGPGEYEVNDVFVTGIRTWHDAEKGEKDGFNTIYLVLVEGMTICHLGDIGHVLTAEQLEDVEDVDILLVPAGGAPIDAAKAAEVVAQIAPKVVIPMQYRAGSGDANRAELAEFVKNLGIDMPEPEDKLVIKPGDLTETIRLVVLNPTS